MAVHEPITHDSQNQGILHYSLLVFGLARNRKGEAEFWPKQWHSSPGKREPLLWLTIFGESAMQQGVFLGAYCPGATSALICGNPRPKLSTEFLVDIGIHREFQAQQLRECCCQPLCRWFHFLKLMAKWSPCSQVGADPRLLGGGGKAQAAL